MSKTRVSKTTPNLSVVSGRRPGIAQRKLGASSQIWCLKATNWSAIKREGTVTVPFLVAVEGVC